MRRSSQNQRNALFYPQSEGKKRSLMMQRFSKNGVL